MFEEINDQMKSKVLASFFLKFKISPTYSLKIIEQWFGENSWADWEVLYNAMQNALVRVENNNLISLYDPKICQLVNDMRGLEGVEIKNRNYRLKTYPLCFIGSEAVNWMEKKYDISKAEALKLGQTLINEKIIHHVTDNHDFKNDYLFYRFYLDE
ncbi:hypothetical protein [Cyanobacterium sp. Dongsha4]|uniref:DEP domain-containing protein n=1 Tax=Cyanobacterium sp. DS4 TaxID=2878255 RepID=UPI002E80C2B2|nr:hypothetical protein [Cyanobacterium sp. Dongsha4]WVK99056.1 hypothetical protein Dongsha4_10110 [Cyanobacterium sp. Dongsha4]